MEATEPTGAQNVAAFLLTLEKDAAAAVLRHLAPAVLVDVVEAMAAPDTVIPDRAGMRVVYRRLVQDLNLGGSGVRRKTDAELTQILESTLGKSQAEAVFAAIRKRRQQERPFLALEGQPAAILAPLLAEQSDAVAALVLAHFEPALSAEVLKTLDAERSVAIVRRMATLVPPELDTLLAVAQDLAACVKEIGTRKAPPDRAVQLKTVAQMLNHSTGEVEKSVLQGLNLNDEALVKEIRELMFTWEDLANLDRRAMQKVLATVDMHTLAIALKGANAAVESNITDNLSARVKEMLADEREIAGALPLATVQKAREDLMVAVRGLMESGEFRATKSGDQLVA